MSPFQQLHHHVQLAGHGLPEVEDLHDVRVVEPARDAHFTQEPPHPLRPLRHPGPHQLDRDIALDRVLARLVDAGHPAPPEHAPEGEPIVDHLARPVAVRPGAHEPRPILRTHVEVGAEGTFALRTKSHRVRHERRIIQ